MKTYSQKASEVQRDWYVVDATDQTLGRLATQIATLPASIADNEFSIDLHRAR